ncbi:hypothetical protein HYW99_02960, partial [Candidatus Woesearchaeota archaeon]|nr:hypothetical protein [Candidatus Woesearchaeota archaeon]
MTNLYDQILKKILDSMRITKEDTVQWHGTESSEYNRHLSLLISDLMLNRAFQSKLNNLRYYLNPENDVFFGHELLSVFKEMKKESNFSFGDFMKKLDLLLNGIEQKSKPVKFELYYPLNIKTDKKIDLIKFRAIQIEIKSYDDVKVLLEADKLKQGSFRFEKFTKSKYKYIKITLWSRNLNYATEISTKYVNLILGFIAYSQNYKNAPVTIVGIPKELTQLKLNYIFAFENGVYSGYCFFDDKSDDRKIYDLREPDISNLNVFVKQFNSADSAIQEIIFKAMSSYYSGLTESRINYSFLNFWTALEIIALKKKGIRHIEIIKRLKSILLDLKDLEEHKIDKLYSIRNNLVHDGAYNVSQYDRNLLKIYVEIMIEFFMFRLIKYNVQEIQTIFQF